VAVRAYPQGTIARDLLRYVTLERTAKDPNTPQRRSFRDLDLAGYTEILCREQNRREIVAGLLEPVNRDRVAILGEPICSQGTGESHHYDRES
jgi:hypothetical protein